MSCSLRRSFVATLVYKNISINFKIETTPLQIEVVVPNFQWRWYVKKNTTSKYQNQERTNRHRKLVSPLTKIYTHGFLPMAIYIR